MFDFYCNSHLKIQHINIKSDSTTLLLESEQGML